MCRSRIRIIKIKNFSPAERGVCLCRIEILLEFSIFCWLRVRASQFPTRKLECSPHDHDQPNRLSANVEMFDINYFQIKYITLKHDSQFSDFLQNLIHISFFCENILETSMCGALAQGDDFFPR